MKTTTTTCSKIFHQIYRKNMNSNFSRLNELYVLFLFCISPVLGGVGFNFGCCLIDAISFSYKVSCLGGVGGNFLFETWNRNKGNYFFTSLFSKSTEKVIKIVHAILSGDRPKIRFNFRPKICFLRNIRFRWKCCRNFRAKTQLKLYALQKYHVFL